MKVLNYVFVLFDGYMDTTLDGIEPESPESS